MYNKYINIYTYLFHLGPWTFHMGPHVDLRFREVVTAGDLGISAQEVEQNLSQVGLDRF